MRRHVLVLAAPLFLLTAIAVWEPAAQPLGSNMGAGSIQPAGPVITAPPLPASLKFAVVGDAGNGVGVPLAFAAARLLHAGAET